MDIEALNFFNNEEPPSLGIRYWNFHTHGHFIDEMTKHYKDMTKQMFQINSMLRYHYPLIDVDTIDFDKWITLFAEYLYVKGEISKPVIKG